MDLTPFRPSPGRRCEHCLAGVYFFGRCGRCGNTWQRVRMIGAVVELTEPCADPECHGSVKVTTVYDDAGHPMSIERGPCSSGLH
ncbi:hypothetical protein [Streptomyces yaizuensis]|uniref:DUF35 domain-containing protein n=1 Tax=Streptomyces yaizuensis TaxID=2989713 RepID=A0ABQ5P9S9_9ACTN|nr:hypothetical protein [Streptomyces sp. YSPA8]GLF99322.1 hypothetical protein SYYSPA8_33515 [Streptomyces sp. YSPA8]